MTRQAQDLSLHTRVARMTRSSKIVQLIKDSLLETKGIMGCPAGGRRGRGHDAFPVRFGFVEAADIRVWQMRWDGRGKIPPRLPFCFETPSLYIWCRTETGDKGTTWLYADKASRPRIEPYGGYAYAPQDSTHHFAVEILDFMRALACDTALAHPETMERLRHGIPAVRSLWESSQLSEAALPSKPAARRGPRV